MWVKGSLLRWASISTTSVCRLEWKSNTCTANYFSLWCSLCQAYDYEAFPISANNILFWLIIAGHGIVLLEHLTHHHYQNTEYRRWIPLLALWLYRCTLHLSTWRGKFAYSPAPTPVPFILKWWIMICQKTSFLSVFLPQLMISILATHLHSSAAEELKRLFESDTLHEDLRE